MGRLRLRVEKELQGRWHRHPVAESVMRLVVKRWRGMEWCCFTETQWVWRVRWIIWNTS